MCECVLGEGKWGLGGGVGVGEWDTPGEQKIFYRHQWILGYLDLTAALEVAEMCRL